MNSSGHLENAHPPAGPLAQFDKTSRRYQQFLNYKPPPYVSPWASSSGRNVPSSTQPASKPVDTPMQALSAYEQIPPPSGPRRWLCCRSTPNTPEWCRHPRIWITGGESNPRCNTPDCMHARCCDCLLESVEDVPSKFRMILPTNFYHLAPVGSNQIHGSGLNFDSASKAEMHQDRSPEWAKQNPVLPESQTGKSEEKDSYRYSEGRRISGEESGMSVAAGQRNSATLAAMAPVKTEPSPSPESCRFG